MHFPPHLTVTYYTRQVQALFKDLRRELIEQIVVVNCSAIFECKSNSSNNNNSLYQSMTTEDKTAAVATNKGGKKNRHNNNIHKYCMYIVGTCRYVQ